MRQGRAGPRTNVKPGQRMYDKLDDEGLSVLNRVEGGPKSNPSWPIDPKGAAEFERGVLQVFDTERKTFDAAMNQASQALGKTGRIKSGTPNFQTQFETMFIDATETTVKEAVKKHMSIMDDYPLIQRQVAMSYQESKTLSLSKKIRETNTKLKIAKAKQKAAQGTYDESVSSGAKPKNKKAEAELEAAVNKTKELKAELKPLNKEYTSLENAKDDLYRTAGSLPRRGQDASKPFSASREVQREVYEKAVTERLTTTITKVDDVIVRQADEFAEKVIQKSVGAETAAVETTEVVAAAGEITQAAKQSKGFYNLVRAVEGESGISAAAKKTARAALNVLGAAEAQSIRSRIFWMLTTGGATITAIETKFPGTFTWIFGDFTNQAGERIPAADAEKVEEIKNTIVDPSDPGFELPEEPVKDDGLGFSPSAKDQLESFKKNKELSHMKEFYSLELSVDDWSFGGMKGDEVMQINLPEKFREMCVAKAEQLNGSLIEDDHLTGRDGLLATYGRYLMKKNPEKIKNLKIK